jgi:hypothetical protein
MVKAGFDVRGAGAFCAKATGRRKRAEVSRTVRVRIATIVGPRGAMERSKEGRLE